MAGELDKLAEYGERAKWAKEHGDKEEFIKYYDLYKEEYEALTRKKFDDEFDDR